MQTGQLLKLIKYLLYLLALTPLIITPFTIFPFNFGRGLIIQFLIEIIAGLYLVLAIFNKGYRPKRSALLYAFGAFVFVMLAASIFGADFNKSFWSNEERLTGWFYLFHIFLIFIVLSNIFKEKKDWQIFLFFNILTALAMFGIAALSLFGVKFWGVDLGKRISGTLGNPIFLAAYFIINLLFSLHLFLNEKNKRRFFYFFAAIILIFGIFLTQSRGAYIGLIGGLSVAFICIIFFGKNKRPKIYFSGGIFIFLALLSLIFIFKDAKVVKNIGPLDRISTISLSDTSVKTRLLGWQIAVKSIKERPLLGWGEENFNIAFNKFYNPELLKFSYYETWFDKPHNKILEVASQNGIIGLFAYIFIFGSAFYLIRKKQIAEESNIVETSVFAGGLTAYFTQNLFVFDTPVSYLAFVFLLAYINTSNGLWPNEKNNRKIPPSIIFGVIFSVIGISWFLNGRPLYASVKLRQNTLLYEYNQKINLDGYKKAIKYFNPYKEEWRVDLAKSILADIKTESGLYYDEEAVFGLSELQKNVREHPKNAYDQMLLGIFYTELIPKNSDYKILGKNHLDKALELSPRRQHIYFALGRYYIVLGNMGEAEKMYKEAIKLEPKAHLAYWEAAKNFLSRDVNDKTGAEWALKAVEMGYHPETAEEALFIITKFSQHFLSAKNYKILANVYESMQEFYPNDAKWYAQEATARYFNKEYVRAAFSIKKATELDESYKKEGEEFLKMISTECKMQNIECD